MATYKAEFLSHYYAKNRRSLTAYFFGNIHELARAASMAPRIANALAKAPLAGRAAGIHRERSLPRFAPRTFRAWHRARQAKVRAGAREVVLFPDTFNNFFEPEVAIAATEVLERAGFAVRVPERDLCCGRPLYDQGMLDRAKDRLRRVMDALTPALERGACVVGLEPSCILTFRDELPALFPADARASKLRDRSLLLDEFLAREAPDFLPPAIAARALLHGHCHQKAIAGLDSETSLLSRAQGLSLRVLDAGCCGMAGPFGYERDHYEVSKACAERVLLPSIRESAPDTIVIADGFSCRTQIRQFCPDRRPMHLAQALNLGR
jgi:Fe-S oxidoreductase